MLDWLFLTKRPQRVLEMTCGTFWKTHQNAWLGVTVENQEMADERIPVLLKIPAAVRFVSYEPALGPVDIEPYLRCPGCGYSPADMLYHGDHRHCTSPGPCVDWLIAGGESGPNARPPHPDWFRRARKDCQAAGVPLFFKQWGKWAPYADGHLPAEDQICGSGMAWVRRSDGRWSISTIRPWEPDEDDSTVLMSRVGKKVAGRLLDGRTWDEVPESPANRKGGNT